MVAEEKSTPTVILYQHTKKLKHLERKSGPR